ncbi:MAG: hypothetical protein HC805_01550 [Alkalinema sp. RL_2_19]|nr:hypothetical protein [Alkalinema sp. RL_2_19]
MQAQTNVVGWDHVLLGQLALEGEFYTIPAELMSASDLGVSSSIESTAKSQLIQGSLTERMPVWVRQLLQQKTIWNCPHLSQFEKVYISLWSYGHYFATHGFKMWVKSVSPSLFAVLKRVLKRRFNPGQSVA